MFRAELYRAFWNRNLLLAIGLGLALLAYWLTPYCPLGPLPGDAPFVCNAYDGFIWALEGPIGLVVPLLAVLPFADSLCLDRQSGYLRNIFSRCSYHRYLGVKCLVNLAAGGIALTVPLLALFIATNLLFPRGIMPADQSRIIPGGYPSGPFSTWYRSMPDLYILSRIGLGFVFGATYATVGLALALFINNRYIVLATPFVAYMLANFVLTALGLMEWSPPFTLTPEIVLTTSALTVFGELGAIFIASVVCILIFGTRARVAEAA